MIDKQIRILMVEDHKIVRDGIRSMLESYKEEFPFIIHESPDGRDAVEKVKTNNYDIILMDYALPEMNGDEISFQMLTIKPSLKILVLSNYDEDTYVKKMMKIGAKGYLLKNISPEELVLAITKVLNGKTHFSDEIYWRLWNHSEEKENIYSGSSNFKNKLNGSETSIPNGVKLTHREREILILIARHQTNEAIAITLNINKRTVANHKQNMYHKCGVKNCNELVKYVVEFNLI
jgi:DNA-binding NarL/FixJ family response regulator